MSQSSPANEALNALIGQFSQRSAFVRELIQNSLDAGAGRVELLVEQVGRRLKIQVVDDGEGMDRAIIEDYLLTLFRSTKEQDLTKIGKFGIGFVSLFSVKPELVVVDTARDGVHHRVVFDDTQKYTLARVDEPFEGTTVTLFVRTWGKPAGELAAELRGALHYWCRYARADVATEGIGVGWTGWAWEEVAHPFDVDAPVKVSVEHDGFRAVLGLRPEADPVVGFYNRGLTLLEAKNPTLPGVAFRVEARVLEHTLTRDNVMRDAGYQRVMSTLLDLVTEQLVPAWAQAVRDAAAAQDWDRHAELLAACPHAPIPKDLPLLRRASGGLATLAAMPKRWLGEPSVLWADQGSALVDALEDDGQVVLLGPASERPEHHVLVLHHPAAAMVDAWTDYLLPREAEWTPLLRALQQELTGAWKVLPATFEGGGAELQGRLALRQRVPFTLEAVDRRKDTGTILVDPAHPLARRADALPAPLGAQVLAVAVLRALGLDTPLPDDALLTLIGEPA
jgi:hypothetical protein